MKRSILLQCNWLLIALAVVFFFQRITIAADELAQIKQAIANKGVNWTAGESWVTRLSSEEQKKFCSAMHEPPDPSLAKLLSIPLIDSLPPVFDWRDNNGNWVTPVKNQGSCGSCWDFSAVAQVESWWKIRNNEPDSMIDLSEQFVLSCSDGSCNGWDAALALEFIKSVGVPSEACFEYQASDNIPCSDACSDWEDEAIKIPGWGFITLEEGLVDNIKSAVYRHPASAWLVLYSDFPYYSSGVYEHVWGDYAGWHDVLIVGWNDAEQSWICKNSWAKTWGDDGYFRIKWGECSIGQYIAYIWDDVTATPAIDVEPDRFDLTMTVGDSSVETITIHNSGSSLLEFSAMDRLNKPVFHPDSFMSWDDMSWWCGDSRIGGYGNSWLEYLDTPILDLSNTSEPHLSSMGFWAVEQPAGDMGYDGHNVWISVDGGKTFNVIYPTSPEYNCPYLCAFDLNLGVGVPGWGGNSNGWAQLDFDLSAYKSDSVIIRYAFASDQGMCTVDNPPLYGLFVDEIVVSDGSNLLFDNHGNDIDSMQKTSCGSLLNADWLDISNGAGTISPNHSSLVNMTIGTRDLEPGIYNALIEVSSNDTTNPILEIPMKLELRAPDHDIAVEEIWPPVGNAPIFVSHVVSAKVINVGINDEADFDVVYNLLDNGESIYDETVHVPSLLAGNSQVLKFMPLIESQPAELELVISVTNLVNDYNSYNNEIRSTVNMTNLVDSFERETGLWEYGEYWGITDRYRGHTGDHSVHVNGGSQYLNNMDAVMTFKPGFELHSVDKATLQYWTKYYTEEDKDVCYLEVSGDSLNWDKMDSLSGSQSQWSLHEVGLTDFIKPEYHKLWVRFRFVSDSVNTRSLGVVIDDVGIYPVDPTEIHAEPINASIPDRWSLSQNYPNPFNPKTVLSFTIPKRCAINLKIYNMLGKVAEILINDKIMDAGHHRITWNASDLPSGIYFYQLEATGQYSAIKKCVLIK